MAIDLKLIDRLLADYKKPEDIIGENGLLKQLTKAILERAMQAEMTEHLGYEKHDQAGNNSGNSRNGKTTKALKGDFGEMPLETPRDRNGTFDPKMVAKGQTRFTGFDDKIVSMYARGMRTREITGHLEEIDGVEVSPTLISSVTEAVMEEVKVWQGRPLETVYPIVYPPAPNGARPLLTYGYDAMGRPNTLSPTNSSGFSITGVNYGPAGETLQILGLGETRTYNSLLQLTSITGPAISRQYTYPDGSNIGKITKPSK